jgi:hypothetical protein
MQPSIVVLQRQFVPPHNCSLAIALNNAQCGTLAKYCGNVFYPASARLTRAECGVLSNLSLQVKRRSRGDAALNILTFDMSDFHNILNCNNYQQQQYTFTDRTFIGVPHDKMQDISGGYGFGDDSTTSYAVMPYQISTPRQRTLPPLSP